MPTTKHTIRTAGPREIIVCVWDDGLVTGFDGATFEGIGRKKLPHANVDAFAADVPATPLDRLASLFAKHRVSPPIDGAIRAEEPRLAREIRQAREIRRSTGRRA